MSELQLTALQGDPLDSPWQLNTGRFRYDIVSVGYAQVGSSIALDFLVLCFPLPVISRLRMAFARKMFVVLIFWLGILLVILSYTYDWRPLPDQGFLAAASHPLSESYTSCNCYLRSSKPRTLLVSLSPAPAQVLVKVRG